MNVLSAPFLYVLPSQVEAFACFSHFIERCLPLYVQPTLTGVHRGLEVGPNRPKAAFPSDADPFDDFPFVLPPRSMLVGPPQLLDRCLEAVDPELAEHLKRKGLSAELYAFPCKLSFRCHTWAPGPTLG